MPEQKYVLIGVMSTENNLSVPHLLIHDTYDHCMEVAKMQDFSQSRYLKVYIQEADIFFKDTTLVSQ